MAVCDALMDMGFPDPAVAYRGRYSTREGAREAMGPGGVEGVAERECRRLGWREVDPWDAKPGDIGVYGDTLALCMGEAWAVKSERGMSVKRTVRRAWRPQ